MDKVEKHGEICTELNELYRRKNNDYGDSITKTFNKYGVVSFLVRFEDKINRIDSLRQKEQLVNDESIKDSLLDLANYAIAAVMELERGEE